jgi:hypothetical protein
MTNALLCEVETPQAQFHFGFSNDELYSSSNYICNSAKLISPLKTKMSDCTQPSDVWNRSELQAKSRTEANIIHNTQG